MARKQSIFKQVLPALIATTVGSGIGAVASVYVALRNSPITPNAKLFIECTTIGAKPVTPRNDGVLHVLDLTKPTSLLHETTHSAKEVHLVTPPQMGPIGQCRISNYGAATAANLVVQFNLTFHESITAVPQVMQGKVVLQNTNKIRISKVEPGSEGAFTYYVINRTRDFVYMTLLPNVTFELLGEPKARTEHMTISPAPFPYFPPAHLGELIKPDEPSQKQ